MVSKKKDLKTMIEHSGFDDRWTGETISFIVDGYIYDLDLHAKHSVKKRMLPNKRTLALSECLRMKVPRYSGDISSELIKENEKKCFEDPFEFVDEEKLFDITVEYVDYLVELNSDKTTDVKNKIKSQILKSYYGIDWQFGGE